MGKGSSGAIIGTIAGGPIGGLLGGGLGMQADANRAMADAAGGAANAQLRNSQANYANISSIGSQMTTQGLANYDKALSYQSNQLSRQEEMVKQIDPTVLAASQQALKLINGQESSTLAPVRAQRDQQRANLLNTLRQQMGPGAETSTAGRQALNQFDMQTNSLMGQQQQSALGQLGNTFQQFGSYGNQLNQSIGQFANITGERAGLQGNYAQMLNAANGNVYQSSGAPYVGSMVAAQGQQAMGNQLTGLAGQAIGVGATMLGKMG